MAKRCGVRGWTCGRVCGKELTCGLHTCEQRCHEGWLSLSLPHLSVCVCVQGHVGNVRR